MSDDRNRSQIIRIDARNCFVESLSDAFAIGKAHFTFASSANHPVSDRPTAFRYTSILPKCWSCAGS